MTKRDRDRRLVAILRGITPEDVEPIVSTLLEAGFDAIEIPLNSPSPFVSIKLAATLAAQQRRGPERLIGAGTVLNQDDVDRVRDSSGNLIVAPNVDRWVIARARALEMTVMPGVMTPTEALAAIEYGARDLKIFPASLVGPAGISAMRAVLPEGIRLYAVGGVDAGDFGAFAKAGVYGFGLGSCLFKPGHDSDTVAAGAATCMEMMRRIYPGK